MEHPTPQQSVSYSTYEGKFSYWKASLLAVLYVASSFSVGYILNSFLYNGSNPFAQVAISFSVALIIFLVLLLLNVISVMRAGFLSAVLAVGALALGVNFLGSMNIRTIFAVVILALFLIFAGMIGRREIDEVVKIRFFRLSRLVLSPVVLGVAICVALLFFDAFSLRNLTGDNPILPQGAFEKNIEGFSKALSPVLGEIDFSKTLREIANDSVDNAAKTSPLAIPSDLLGASKERALSEYQKRMQEVLGIPVDPDKKISAEIYQSLLNRFNGLEGGMRTLVLGALAFVLFITVTAISPIVRFIAAGIAFLLFELLRALGFIAILYENRSKEFIVLP